MIDTAKLIRTLESFDYEVFIGSLAECIHKATDNRYEVYDISYQIEEIDENITIHNSKPMHYWLKDEKGHIGGIHKYDHEFQWMYMCCHPGTQIIPMDREYGENESRI